MTIEDIKSRVKYLKPGYEYDITIIDKSSFHLDVVKYNSLCIDKLVEEKLNFRAELGIEYLSDIGKFADQLKTAVRLLEEHDIEEHLFVDNMFHENPHEELEGYENKAPYLIKRLEKYRKGNR